MTDEQKNKLPDDEYQFPQDEYVSPEAEGVEHHDENVSNPEATKTVSTEKMSTGAKIAQRLRELPLLKNKRMLIVIVALIVVIVGFRLLHSEKPATVAPAAPAAAPRPVEQTTPTPQPMPIEQPSRAESQIKDLQSQLSNLQNTINQTQAANQTLQNSVTNLTNEVQALTERLNQKAPLAPAKPHYTVFYHLRAVLPDRAWITSSTGKTITVTVGDHVKQYGTVRIIDAQQGIIETSSGRRIVYGMNDY